MSLAHPMIEPQIAMRACTGYFFGGDDKYVALLYSNRIVFKPVDEDTHLISPDTKEDVVISIPQPPMTMGNADMEILPNLGGIFFSVGRNHDMLAIQFKSALVILSVNAVDQVLELQGCWGLSKLKDTGRLHKASSSVSLASYVEHHHPHMPKMRRPGISPRNSASSVQTLGSLKANGSPKPHDDSGAFGRLSLSPSMHPHSSDSSPPGSASGGVASHVSSTRSGLAICSELTRPKPSPDGTQIFVVTKNKYQTLHLVVLSSFGQEVIKMEVEYLNVLSLGWISDETVYIVYLNQNFHKKFQTFRLVNKIKTSGVFGMGRKSAKPSLIPETNVRLAVDFLPSVPDTCGGPDLVFKDYVLLGTKGGGYVRVNYKSSSWEPVLNCRNVLGAVWLDDRAIVVQSSISKTSPWEVSQISYSIISESAVHALKADPRVSACLCSKHNIDSDNRYALKLLYMGNGVILDYKRYPFRAFQYRKGRNLDAAPLTLLPWNGPPSDSREAANNDSGITESSKITQDFLVKTELALYTRDPNGDDNRVCKIMDRDTVLSVPVGRPRLLKLLYRDIKAVWAIYESPAEIRILDESHSKPMKMRNKASYVFPGPYMEWRFGQVLSVFRNVLLVNMIHHEKWATFLVSFVNSTHKSHPTPPQVSLLLTSEVPESPPTMLKTPGNPSKINLQIFDKIHFGFTRQFKLLVSSYGQYRVEQVQTRVVPTSMDESENLAVFTEFDGPLDGMYLAGLTKPPPKPPIPGPGSSPGSVYNAGSTISPGGSRGSPSPSGSSTHSLASPGSLNTPFTIGEARIIQVLTVESPDACNGRTVALPHKDYMKSTVWVFDSNGKEFREFTVQDVAVARVNKMKHCEKLLKTHQSLSNVASYELSPDFERKQFTENSCNNQFRPLPELNAIITRGIGSGLDAEVYLKTPDDGYLAIFRIQNKRLLESLAKLERVVLEKRVGIWLPDELRASWLNDLQESTMIAGSAFSAFWQLNDQQQKDLCREANVDMELIKKIRPP